MVVNLFRSFLAVTGFSLISFSFTFWSHHHYYYQWDQILYHGNDGYDEKRHYFALRSHGRGTDVFHPSRAASTTTSGVHSTNTKTGQVPILHIVYTRFMQHQPDLIPLGLARLELLKEFFLQSLQGQTTHNFLVVIRTDPQLNPLVKQPLLNLFPNITQQQSSPYPFRYLVIGSNTNPKSHHYAHLVQQLEHPPSRHGNGEGENPIWSGTIQQAKDYLMAASSTNAGTRIILETRLDSDDGLHTEYLERLQKEARHTWHNGMTTTTTTTSTTTTAATDTGLWRMWCANKSLEWQYMAPWDVKRQKNNALKKGDEIPHKKNKNEAKNDHKSYKMDDQEDISDSSGLGALVISRFGGCLSAGITLAYQAGPQPLEEFTTIELPSLQRHETLATTIPHCKDESNDERQQQTDSSPSTNCLTLIQLHPSVIRARTPTSAGMLNIFWDWDSLAGDQGGKNHVYEKSHMQKHSNAAVSTQSTESQLELTRAYWMYHKLALQQQPFQENLWVLVPKVFGMTPTRIRHLRDYLSKNMAAIAKDNLMGQCSTGHSCKDASQVMLRKIAAAT